MVSVVSTASNTVAARLGAFSGPVGISLDDRSHTLYVLNTAPTAGSVIPGATGTKKPVEENALVPIDLGGRRVLPSISLPATPRAFGLGQK